jgi:ketosteroid isomerase-like protein
VSQENVEALLRQYERFSRDGGIVADIYAPDAEWTAAREDPDAATHRGVAAIGAYFEQWFGAFEEPELRDGKVVRVEEYFDRAEGLEAAGLAE